MSMKNFTPDIIKATRLSKKVKEGKKPGLNIFLECLVFIAVLLVTTMIQNVIWLGVQMALLVGHSDVMKALADGDIDTFNSRATEVLLSYKFLEPLQLMSLVIITITIAAFCRLIQRRKLSTLGFVKKNMFRDYGIGIVAGFVAFSLAVLICVITGALTLSKSANFDAAVFVLYIIGWFFQGMEEEVMCRGYLLPSISRRYSVWVGVIANAGIFAALHLGNAGIGVLPIINLFLFGVFASLVFVKTENIWLCSAIHSVWNFVQGNFYGILVSGGTTTVTVFDSTMNAKKTLINGGAFGLEGGLGVTISMALGCAIMLWLIKKSISKNQATDNK